MAEGTEGDIEWGEGCDTELGLVKVPISNAAPCVEPWDETEDNGGATSQGVTADEILVVNYMGQPDPLQQALVEDAGANTDPEVNNQVEVDYINLFTDVYETYGRTVRVETIEASGGPMTPPPPKPMRSGPSSSSRSRWSAPRRPTPGRRRSPTPASSASAAAPPRTPTRSRRTRRTGGRRG